MNSSVLYRVNLAKPRRQRKGLTLIEAAVVLGLLAIVLAGIMLNVTASNNSQRLSAVAGQIASIQQAIRSLYAGQASYSGLSNAMIQEVLPRSMVASEGNLRHAFNGDIVVAPVSAGGTDNAFSISMGGIPSDPCMKLAAADLGRSVLNLSVGGVDNTAPPLTPTEAKAQCTSNDNELVWTFF